VKFRPVLLFPAKSSQLDARASPKPKQLSLLAQRNSIFSVCPLWRSTATELTLKRAGTYGLHGPSTLQSIVWQLRAGNSSSLDVLRMSRHRFTPLCQHHFVRSLHFCFLQTELWVRAVDVSMAWNGWIRVSRGLCSCREAAVQGPGIPSGSPCSRTILNFEVAEHPSTKQFSSALHETKCIFFIATIVFRLLAWHQRGISS
jgi:hypothetical protein